MDTANLPRLGEVTRDVYQKQMSLEFCKWLGCLGEAGGPIGASESFIQRYPHSAAAALVRQSLDGWGKKSAVAAGTTTGGTWAGPLVAPSALHDAFIAVARSASLLGRIAGLRRVPFNVRVPIQSSGANYQWVSELGTKPASALAFNTGPILTPTKHGAIVPVTRELVELSVAGMEGALQDELLGGLTAYTDRQFLDPAVAAVAGKNPASVTNGTTPIASTGDYHADVQTLLAAFFTGRPNAQNAVLVTHSGNAAAIRSWNAGGGVGVQVLVSDAGGPITVAIDPGAIAVADSGVEITTSREASIQMDDAAGVPDATTVLVSAFQMNLVFFHVERFVNWSVLATGAVRYLAA